MSAVSRTLAIIGAVVVAEPLSATLLFPFVYFMVGDFGVEEQYIGFWAGLITSAFFVPQMLTATLWGIASDKLGRKPVMLVGLLGSACCMLLFGLSRSLAWAILSRGVCGLFNGNAAVARTAVGELAHDAKLNQGKAFSLFGLASAMGYVIGPLSGGFLANPWQRFDLVGPGDILVTYSYLLPCFVSACFNLVTTVLSLFLLDETNQKARSYNSKEPANEGADEDPERPVTEADPLLGDAEPRLTSPTEGPKGIHANSSVLFCVLGIACIAFHAVIFDEIYTIFAATRPEAGLGFVSSDIATSLSLMGPVILFAQLVLFPFLNDRFPALTLWRASTAVFAVVYPLFSLLPHLVAREHPLKTAQWVMLLVLLAVRFTANVVAYTSIAVLLNQVALPQKRGAIMGLGQTAISLGRAAGPVIGGSIWSWSLQNGYHAPLDSHFLFLLELVLALAQLVSSIYIAAPK